MGQKNFRTLTITVSGKVVETLTRATGESFQEFVKRGETAARHNKGEVVESYKPRVIEPVTK